MMPNKPLINYFAKASSIQTCCNIIFNMIFLEPITLHQKKTRQKMEQPKSHLAPKKSQVAIFGCMSSGFCCTNPLYHWFLAFLVVFLSGDFITFLDLLARQFLNCFVGGFVGPLTTSCSSLNSSSCSSSSLSNPSSSISSSFMSFGSSFAYKINSFLMVALHE